MSMASYEEGICGNTITSAGTPAYVSPVGNDAFVYNRKLGDIAQDMIEYWSHYLPDREQGDRGGQRAVHAGLRVLVRRAGYAQGADQRERQQSITSHWSLPPERKT